MSPLTQTKGGPSPSSRGRLSETTHLISSLRNDSQRLLLQHCLSDPRIRTRAICGSWDASQGSGTDISCSTVHYRTDIEIEQNMRIIYETHLFHSPSSLCVVSRERAAPVVAAVVGSLHRKGNPAGRSDRIGQTPAGRKRWLAARSSL